VFKLALAAANVPFEVVELDREAMKADRDQFPFAQAPRYSDNEVDMVQSNAIMRHLGRKHNLYGDGSLKQAAQVDMWLDGVESIRGAHGLLIYRDQLSPEALAEYIELRVDPTTQNGKNGGGHFFYLDTLLKKNNGGKGFCVGDKLSIADLKLWEVLDIHAYFIGAGPNQLYPDLKEVHKRIVSHAGIKECLAGPQRMKGVNGNGLGGPTQT